MAIKRLPRRPCTEGLDSYDQCFSYALSAIFNQASKRGNSVLARDKSVLYVVIPKLIEISLEPIKDIDPKQKRYVLEFADAVFSVLQMDRRIVPLFTHLDSIAVDLERRGYLALARQHRLDLEAGYVM